MAADAAAIIFPIARPFDNSFSKWVLQRCHYVFKSGWATSNVVGIICPLVGIGLTDLPNIRPVAPLAPLAPRFRHYCVRQLKNWIDIVRPIVHAKGQEISEGNCGVFNSSKKTKKNLKRLEWSKYFNFICL